MLDPKPGQTKTAGDRTIDLAADLRTVLAEINAKRAALAMARGWRPVPPWVLVTSLRHSRHAPFAERRDHGSSASPHRRSASDQRSAIGRAVTCRWADWELSVTGP